MNALKERTALCADSLAEHLDQLQSTRSIGCLEVRSANGTQWSLYLFMGRLIWARGGSHPEQRWFRLAAKHLNHLDIYRIKSLTRRAIGAASYDVLLELLRRGQLQRETALLMIQEVVEEILFDLLYEAALFSLPGSTVPLDYQFQSQEKLDNPISLLRIQEVYDQAQTALRLWHQSPLAGYSPNTAPVIQHPTLLQHQITASEYERLSSVINGRHSLRNLSLILQKDLLDLAEFLSPLIEAKTIRLDYEQEQATSQLESQSSQESPRSSTIRKYPTIACIDDSPIICQQLEQEVTGSGYQFFAIQDPTTALPTLLRKLPDLIFLDLVMPKTNGYELCAQIRRTRKLKDVPVVILTSSTGLIFQARARMVGSTDYLTKPIRSEAIAQVLNRYLAKV